MCDANGRIGDMNPVNASLQWRKRAYWPRGRGTQPAWLRPVGDVRFTEPGHPVTVEVWAEGHWLNAEVEYETRRSSGCATCYVSARDARALTARIRACTEDLTGRVPRVVRIRRVAPEVD